MFRSLALNLLLLATTAQAIGEDCLDAAPATVYEAAVVSPQNMDFDKDNNMFVAHSGWYNDREVHYYKFRMFTPSTYSGLIDSSSNFGDVPMQKIYIVTTTDDFTGAIGNPIIEYHTADGNLYSDFMEVIFVTAPTDYTENLYKSAADITSSGASTTESGIILNIPVVPTGATLQHPQLKGTNKAPISPVPVWYKCQEVWTYVFEATDGLAKAHFSSTRENPDDADFRMTIINFANAKSGVFAIPLWHFNQFSQGVTDANGGGPSAAGMRNLINLDRGDAGYSPLWHINWMTELPQNYLADELSNNADLSVADGFVSIQTPMFINCPDVGSVGSQDNPAMTDVFNEDIDSSLEFNMIQGSHGSFIMTPGVAVTIQADTGTVIATVETNMMGAYEYNLDSLDIPANTRVIDIISGGNVIRAINLADEIVGEGETLSPTKTPTTETSGSFLVNGFVAVVASALVVAML